MNEKEKMNEPLSVIYADAKTSVTLAVRNAMKAFPLPIFMFESILSGILGEIRSEENMELSTDFQRYKGSLLQYHQAEVKELAEGYEKEKEDLIRGFEGSGGGTSENESEVKDNG